MFEPDLDGEWAWYHWGRLIVAVPCFIGIWIWSFVEWGVLVGLAIGWLPALIGAGIISGLWPVLLILIGILFLSMLNI